MTLAHAFGSAKANEAEARKAKIAERTEHLRQNSATATAVVGEQRHEYVNRHRFSRASVLFYKSVFDVLDDGTGAIDREKLGKKMIPRRPGELSAFHEAMAAEVSRRGDRMCFRDLLRVIYPESNATDEEVDLMMQWACPVEAGPPPPTDQEIALEKLTPSAEAELRELFRMYSGGRNGKISKRQMRRALQSSFISGEEVDQLYDEADTDQNGTLSYTQFFSFMIKTGAWDAGNALLTGPVYGSVEAKSSKGSLAK